METHLHTPDDLLHAYLDRELDPTLEQQFFTLLASDSDLRDRFRQLRALRSEARKFMATAAPPPEAAAALFSRLGFALHETAHPRSAAAAGWLTRAWAPMASAAAAAAITAMLFLGLRGTMPAGMQPVMADRGSQPSETVLPQAPASSSADAEYRSGDQPLRDARTESMSANAVHRSAPAASQQPGTAIVRNEGNNPVSDRHPGHQDARSAETEFTNPTLIAQTQPSGDAAARAGETPEAKPARETKDAPALAARSDAPGDGEDDLFENWQGIAAATPPAEDLPFIAASQEAVFPQAASTVDTRQYFPTLSSRAPMNLTLELRGINAANFPSPTVGTHADPWMQNLAVAVFYSGNRHDVGLEFGQEPFAQHYSGVENGKAVRYEQNLLTPWLLGSYRYRFSPMTAFGGIEPYLTVSMGASMQFWPLARTGFGVMYMPDRRVRFHVGLEGSVLAFPYQDRWFTSKRLGMTYGISILF